MKHSKKILVLFLLVFSLTTIYSQYLPAFPGASGFGANTIGGRGGRIIRVTNLRDTGTGSFRWALDQAPLYANEPRIIIFDVCGVIEGKFQDRIWVRYPYTTIAGQTAPGDGIVLKGCALCVGTHNVIVRGMRCRPGDNNGWTPPAGTLNNDGPDGLTISNQLQLGDIYNVIIDHCSVSWGTDENSSSWSTVGKIGVIRDITFQWNIISEGLNCTGMHIENGEVQCHSCGLLIGSQTTNASVHHNLMAHNKARNPLVSSGQTCEVINNTIYNWRDEASQIANKIDLINNFYKVGVDWKHHLSPNPAQKSYWEIESSASTKTVYVKGNIGRNRPTDDLDDWALVYTSDGNITKIKSATRVINNTILPTVIDPTMEAHNNVLKYAGAIAPKRDATDARVAQTVIDGTGRLIDHISDIGGYPEYTSICDIPVDTDGDGMPDWFEEENGLNKLVKDGNGTDLSVKFTGRVGYTNVEVYINHLIDRQLNLNTSVVTPTVENEVFSISMISNNSLNITSIKPIQGVELFNLQGMRVFNSLFDSNTTVSVQNLNLLQGIYVLSIKYDNNKVYNKKIVITV